MSNNHGQITYGILFPAHYTFPWDSEGIENWWVYTIHKQERPFSEPTVYATADKRTEIQRQIKTSTEARDKFLAENPLPVLEIREFGWEDGSDGIILAVPESIVRLSDDKNPFEFNPEELVVSPASKEQLERFVLAYCQPEDSYATSYESDVMPDIKLKWMFSCPDYSRNGW